MTLPLARMRPVPPPSDLITAEVSQRWAETSRRRRILDATWKHDLELRMQKQLGTTRRELFGPLSLAFNPFKSVCKNLSVLYSTAPIVTHPRVEKPALEAIVERAGLWPMMSLVQFYTIGLQQMFVRADFVDGRLVYRMVFPDLVVAHSKPETPSKPYEVYEWRLRDGKWTIDHLSVEDKDNPIYRVLDAEDISRDITREVLGESFSGDAYPFRRTGSDEPVLNYVLYHESGAGTDLFTPFADIELVEGTLDVAVQYQGYLHEQRDASWPQRYVANLQVVGGTAVSADNGEQRQEVVADQAVLLQLETPRELTGEKVNAPPLIGQFKPGATPETTLRTLRDLAAELAAMKGITPSDIQRLGATARSGAAIALTNEGERRAQARYQSVFGPCDRELLALSAIVLNRQAGSKLFEAGYEVRYREIPLSPDERKARREEALEMLEAGLIDRVQAFRVVHPEMSEHEAARVVARGRGDVAPEVEVGPEDVDLDEALDQLDDLRELVEGAVQLGAGPEFLQMALAVIAEVESLVSGADRVEPVRDGEE